ncbi:hypothetical protein [Alicyclobacillus dauci]|uniref:Signal transducing protein n=1 Tax=Alicyclobacillus dauci TaxID=1475485 RepID=A0ABY6YXR6_9BACL|nr:hypothetical protein [Alicyclobacillus dauci]WAH35197.1 hypothetical protein NZD86_12825 [Alicyclobacillus dauci]
MKKTLIFSTFNEADYMAVMNKLDAEGVPYVLKSKRSNEFLGSQWSNLNNHTEYNFYVKPEDEGRAYKALNQK